MYIYMCLMHIYMCLMYIYMGLHPKQVHVCVMV
jgi:hypothetical protein